ncbi:MAG: hypothetical protein C4524_15525 [Candidatus Zixiibacteriota bacterium]|nr:MAG: hypothetical protein C4524_15525 [candidate division Zixibacteria bacterium]
MFRDSSAYADKRTLVFGVTYHGSTAEPQSGLDNVYGKHISAGKLRVQLTWLARHFRVMTIAEILRRCREGNLPARTAFVAFHDGYAGNYHVAFPLLKELGIPADMLVPTAMVGTSCRFWVDVLDAALKHTDRRECSVRFEEEGLILPLETPEQRLEAAVLLRKHLKWQPEPVLEARLAQVLAQLGWDDPAGIPRLGEHETCLDWNQVREMAQAGIAIGSHTHRHVICAQQDAATVYLEMDTSRHVIQAETGQPCRVLCYPNGSYPRSGCDATDVIARGVGYECVLYMMEGHNLVHPRTFRLTGTAFGEQDTLDHVKYSLSAWRFKVRQMRGRKLWKWNRDTVDEPILPFDQIPRITTLGTKKIC